MNYKCFLMSWIGCLLWLAGHAQQPAQLERNLSGTYKVDPAQATVHIINKYGNITVLEWDKDSVRVDARMTVKSTTMEKAQKLYAGFDIDLSPNGSYITGRTLLLNSSPFITDFYDMAHMMVGNSNTVTINYTVYAPASCALRLENKFGDIFLGNPTGDVYIDLSNGNLRANQVKSNATIAVRFGNCNISKLTGGRLTIEFSDLNLKETGKISLSSKSSHIDIDKCTQATIDSKRDKINILDATQVNCTGSFSNLDVEKISKELIATIKYGSIRVDEISAGFTMVNVNATFSDADLYFSKAAGFALDLIHSSKTDVTLPETFTTTSTTVIDKDNTRITGNIAGYSSPKVTIVAKYGTVNVVQR